MTVTDAPAPAPAPATASAPEVRRRPGGLAATLGTADPIVLARLWIAASTLFLFSTGVAGAIIGVERLDTASVDVLDGALGDLASLHVSAGIFLFLVPMTLGVATAVVPLQLGRPDRRLPARRVGRLLDVAAVRRRDDRQLLHRRRSRRERPRRRRPLVRRPRRRPRRAAAGDDHGADDAVGGARRRDASRPCADVQLGDARRRLGLARLAAGPARPSSCSSTSASATAASSRSRWPIGRPARPRSSPTRCPPSGSCSTPWLSPRGVVWRTAASCSAPIGAAGVLSFGAWLVAATDDPSIYEDALYVGAAFALLLPLLAVGGGVADTLRRGKPALTSGLLFGIAAYLMLLAAAAANALRVIDGLDLTGTTADSSVAHFALLAGLIGVAGAVHHWSSKIFGVVLGEGSARLGALVLLLGTVLLALPDLISGFLDQPANLLPGQPEDGVEALNAVSLAGGGRGRARRPARRRQRAGRRGEARRRARARRPVGPGQTLEWLAVVASRRRRRGAARAGRVGRAAARREGTGGRCVRGRRLMATTYVTIEDSGPLPAARPGSPAGAARRRPCSRAPRVLAAFGALLGDLPRRAGRRPGRRRGVARRAPTSRSRPAT